MVKINAVGFSGHQGISADAAAGTYKWVERHFTLDRTLKVLTAAS